MSIIIIHDNKIGCQSCKYYEAYHQYTNPLAVARHYCTKCNDEIKVLFGHRPYLPKGCYFNNYYEESDEHKKAREASYDASKFDCQIED